MKSLKNKNRKNVNKIYPKCNACNNDGINKCSKCKTTFYCSKECQIKDFKMHKKVCKMYDPTI